jgi:hypothetical protein
MDEEKVNGRKLFKQPLLGQEKQGFLWRKKRLY